MNETVSPISEYPAGLAPQYRFVSFTDPHATARTPSSRVDDYLGALYEKLKEVIRTAHQVEADAVICQGDFANSPWLSIGFADEMADFLKTELKDMPFYYLPGNHDVEAYNPASFRTTAFGMMIKMLPTARVIYKGNPIAVTNKRGNKILLSGVPSYAMLDRDIETDVGFESRTRDYVVEELSEIPRIHLVHGMLLPRPLVEDAPFTLIKDILHTNATVTLTGHDHTGFAPVRTEKGGWVWNPGSLMRVFASEEEMLRTPKYGIIDIFGVNDAKIYVQEVKCAKPGNEILDRSRLDAEKERKEILEQMAGSINAVLGTISIESVRIEDLLGEYKGKVPDDVYEETVRRINKAKIDLKIVNH